MVQILSKKNFFFDLKNDVVFFEVNFDFFKKKSVYFWTPILGTQDIFYFFFVKMKGYRILTWRRTFSEPQGALLPPQSASTSRFLQLLLPHPLLFLPPLLPLLLLRLLLRLLRQHPRQLQLYPLPSFYLFKLFYSVFFLHLSPIFPSPLSFDFFFFFVFFFISSSLLSPAGIWGYKLLCLLRRRNLNMQNWFRVCAIFICFICIIKLLPL